MLLIELNWTRTRLIELNVTVLLRKKKNWKDKERKLNASVQRRKRNPRDKKCLPMHLMMTMKTINRRLRRSNWTSLLCKRT